MDEWRNGGCMNDSMDGWIEGCMHEVEYGWMDYAHTLGKSDPLDDDFVPQEPWRKRVGHRSVRSEA